MFDARTDSPEILGSLGTLSTFYTDNTAAERRRLRATVEKQGRNINEQFLAAAEEVMQASNDGCRHGLNSSYGSITLECVVQSLMLLFRSRILQRQTRSI